MANQIGGEPYPTTKEPVQDHWQTGMWDCFSDLDSCFMGCCCQPAMVGRLWNASKYQKSYSQSFPVCCGVCLFPGILPCMVCHLRGVVRKTSDTSPAKDNPRTWIPGSPLEDCACGLCCAPCALCHMSRELKQRGFTTGTLCDCDKNEMTCSC